MAEKSHKERIIEAMNREIRDSHIADATRLAKKLKSGTGVDGSDIGAVAVQGCGEVNLTLWDARDTRHISKGMEVSYVDRDAGYFTLGPRCDEPAGPFDEPDHEYERRVERLVELMAKPPASDDAKDSLYDIVQRGCREVARAWYETEQEYGPSAVESAPDPKPKLTMYFANEED